MNNPLTDTERQEINEGLARAMGYPLLQCSACDEIVTSGVGVLNHRHRAMFFEQDLPDFTRDASASRSLIIWLSRQSPTLWQVFAHKLWLNLGSPQIELLSGGGFNASLMPYMTADLEVIALAAFQAIGVEDEQINQ